ncbi:hypothetical protein [Shewanella sp. Isolate7]|uniref:hypothetical protein n=1 Tax=Shewanella sp. Isolate7 TaxID=2908528 RepID=UPI001EFE1707|nr:hypothetical protein [Shewanella sp. Isolate7]MCG9719777.1 hypothetical protein [Shewanella sp. Isolate7]
MKMKYFVVFALILGVVVILPKLETTYQKATLSNDKGETVQCEVSWTGFGFGETLSDGKYQQCIDDYIDQGYVISRNEKRVEKVGAQLLSL